MNENETQLAYFDDLEITHKANPQKLTVSSWAEYYAFGKVARASCSGAGSYRYGYQGEFAEKDGETDWNSFELRQYDSDIARWLSVDPYQQYWSPYVGMGNDPVNQIDPDGGLSGGGGGEITPITPRGYQPLSPSGNVCPPDIKMTPGAGGSNISPPSPPVTSLADRAASWMAAAASRVTPFMGGAAAFAGAMLMPHPAGDAGAKSPMRQRREQEVADNQSYYIHLGNVNVGGEYKEGHSFIGLSVGKNGAVDWYHQAMYPLKIAHFESVDKDAWKRFNAIGYKTQSRKISSVHYGLARAAVIGLQLTPRGYSRGNFDCVTTCQTILTAAGFNIQVLPKERPMPAELFRQFSNYKIK